MTDKKLTEDLPAKPNTFGLTPFDLAYAPADIKDLDCLNLSQIEYFSNLISRVSRLDKALENNRDDDSLGNVYQHPSMAAGVDNKRVKNQDSLNSSAGVKNYLSRKKAWNDIRECGKGLESVAFNSVEYEYRRVGSFCLHSPKDVMNELKLSDEVYAHILSMSAEWRKFAKKNKVSNASRYDFSQYLEQMFISAHKYRSACVDAMLCQLEQGMQSETGKRVNLADYFLQKIEAVSPTASLTTDLLNYKDVISTEQTGAFNVASLYSTISSIVANGGESQLARLNKTLECNESILRVNGKSGQITLACLDGAVSRWYHKIFFCSLICVSRWTMAWLKRHLRLSISNARCQTMT